MQHGCNHTLNVSKIANISFQWFALISLQWHNERCEMWKLLFSFILIPFMAMASLHLCLEKKIIPTHFAYSFQHKIIPLSKAQEKFGDKVFIFYLGCCYRHVALSPVVTCQPLRWLAATCKWTRLQATIMLPMETGKHSCLW